MLYNTEYKLTRDNYSDFKILKNVLLDIHSIVVETYKWLKHRFNKKYNKTAPFTIGLNGCVYNHFRSSILLKFLTK